MTAIVLTLLVHSARAETIRLDADMAVRRALEVSNPAAAAVHRVEAAHAAVRLANAAVLPAVGLAAAITQRSSVPEFAAPVDGPGEPPIVLFPDIRTTYSASLSVTQPLYEGGAIQARRKAARGDAAAAKAHRLTVTAEVRLAARLRYWSAVTAGAAVDLASAQFHRAEHLAGDARTMVATGIVVEADALAAAARAAAARVRLLRAKSDSDVALEVLRSLLQLPTEATVELADPHPPLSELQDTTSSLTELALERRPELAQLRGRIASLGARETAAAAAAGPRLNAAATWELARPNQRYLPLSDRWNDSWAVGIGGVWVFYDGGRSRAEVAAVAADRAAVESELAELQRRIALEVGTANASLSTSREAVGAAMAARRAAVAREQAVKQRRDAGLATVAELLDAQADLAAAEFDELAARSDVQRSLALVERAVGQ